MIDRFAMYGAALAIALGLCVFQFTPGIYNTIHMHDTLFLAEIGWRTHLGAVPVIDFNHFYGGITAEYISWAFGIFGTGIKSIDYAIFLQFLTLAVFCIAICFKRTGFLTFWMLLLLITALILTRTPLEVISFVNIRHGVAADSFVYNRFATALALVLAVYAILPTQNRKIEIVGAILCAVASFMIIMSKPTFITVVPAMMLTLAAQRRWGSLLGYAVGLVVTFVVFDPWGDKFIGSFDYAIVTTSSNAPIMGMFLKVNLIIWYQWLFTIPAMLALFVALRSGNPEFRRIALSSVLLMGGCLGMTATMGWTAHLGQQAVPFFAAFALAYFEYARKHEILPFQRLQILKIIGLATISVFSIPLLASNIVVLTKAVRYQDFALIERGPLRGYVAWSPTLFATDGLPMDQARGLDYQISLAVAQLESTGTVNIGIEYVMLADGVRSLSRIENIDKMGIVSDSHIVFSYAMEAPPVLDYPAWVSMNSPELAEGVPLSRDVDVILASRIQPTRLTDILLTKMNNDFSLCISEGLWNIYVRNQSHVVGCTE